ncbi:MAG: PilZ domain-containing protein [Deltaproteobacteria bacterium]|nr:PilZ domain-containing protein [Deltaproteobacteria bacterium]
MIERRNHPRVKVSHPALYVGESYHTPRVATTVDLSLGGARIETPYSLIPGERLQISIAVHPQVIQCRGTVVRSLELTGERRRGGARYEAGVRFEEMSLHDRHHLSRHITRIMEPWN